MCIKQIFIDKTGRVVIRNEPATRLYFYGNHDTKIQEMCIRVMHVAAMWHVECRLDRSVMKCERTGPATLEMFQYFRQR
jgi:hypothetical protein